MTNIIKNIPRICVEKIDNLYTGNGDIFSAVFLKKKIWPENSDITIHIKDTSMIPRWTNMSVMESKNIPIDYKLENKIRKMDYKDAIETVIKERIIPIVGKGINIRFVGKDENPIVRVGFDIESGCWALIGTDHINSKEDTTVNFAWLDVGTILHEFCHVLGMIHEFNTAILLLNYFNLIILLTIV